MKISVIGGASSYTPELVEGLLARASGLGLSEICLMDPNSERLEIIYGLACRMGSRSGSGVAVRRTDDLDESVDGATFVITQIRVGGGAARVHDEQLGMRHGLIGQETTGVGGFACALRTIPQVLKVARAMEASCPDAFLLNFTNPAGLITEAVLRHSPLKTVGLCNIPIGMEMEIAGRYGCEADDVVLDYVGLNHLSWVRGVSVEGRDVTGKALEELIDDAESEWGEGPIAETMQREMKGLGKYCNPYLQYFYATEDALARQRSREKTRGEEVLEIEQRLFEQYADPDLERKPEELSERGGAHYSTAALRLIEAIAGDTGSRQIVCCRNDGAVPTLDSDAAVEVPAKIGRDGASGIPQREPEADIAELLETMKAYETLTVDAAVRGDRRIALLAMARHPLMPDARDCEELLDELLEVNEPYLLDTFFRERTGATHGS